MSPSSHRAAGPPSTASTRRLTRPHRTITNGSRRHRRHDRPRSRVPVAGRHASASTRDDRSRRNCAPLVGANTEMVGATICCCLNLQTAAQAPSDEPRGRRKRSASRLARDSTPIRPFRTSEVSGTRTGKCHWRFQRDCPIGTTQHSAMHRRRHLTRSADHHTLISCLLTRSISARGRSQCEQFRTSSWPC